MNKKTKKRLIDLYNNMEKDKSYRPFELKEKESSDFNITSDLNFFNDLGIVERNLVDGLIYYKKI